MEQIFHLTLKKSWEAYYSIPEDARSPIELHRVTIGENKGTHFKFHNVFRDWVALSTKFKIPEFVDPYTYTVDTWRIIKELEEHDSLDTVELWTQVVSNDNYILFDDDNNIITAEELINMWEQGDAEEPVDKFSFENVFAKQSLSHVNDGHWFSAKK